MKAIAVDTGGTFTDMAVLDSETGQIRVLKLPSTPADPGKAIVNGLTELFRSDFRPEEVMSISHGTTVGTNALLTDGGAEVGLLITEGFGAVNDVWHLAPSEDTSRAPSPYETKRPPVQPRLRRGAKERIDANGQIIRPLDTAHIRADIESLVTQGVESVAVVLLFSFLNPTHENQIAELIAKEVPHLDVSLSSQVLPQMREFSRLSTTVANARISPMMRHYLAKLEDRIHEQKVYSQALYVMQSNGGVSNMSKVTPVTTILSGPCAGAIAAIEIAKSAGFDKVLSLDMGGTSTDIALGHNGQIVETNSGRIGNWEIAVPMLMINTIGAGGGTLATIDSGGGLRVGPESAGADPGPVCYGIGCINPTVTDANLVLGFLNPDSKLAGRVDLRKDLAFDAIERLGQQIGLSTLQTAEGIISITNAKMAEGIRAVSTEQGHDLRDFTLVAFGGGGPAPAAKLAGDLKIRSVIVPPAPGVTSALGLLMADPRRDYVTSRLKLLSNLDSSALSIIFKELETNAIDDFTKEGYSLGNIHLSFAIDMRYLGQGYEITVSIGESTHIDGQLIGKMRLRFDKIHNQMFGHCAPLEEVEAVNYRLRASVIVPKAVMKKEPPATADVGDAKIAERDVCFDASKGTLRCPIYDRKFLQPSHSLEGPAIIEQLDSTTVVYPMQTAVIDDYLNIVIKRNDSVL